MTAPVYLSQITLPYERALREKLRSSYDWHRWIWRAFPNAPDQSRDFLFRVDTKDRIVRVLLLSCIEPSPIDDWVWETKTVSKVFLSQKTYRFQVRVNPTFRRSSDHRRIPLYKEGDIRDWLARKLSAMGAELVSAEVGNPQDEAFVKDGKRGKHVAVDIRGVLAIRDNDAFIEAFPRGIGSAKGFGYGMLMLKPVQF